MAKKLNIEEATKSLAILAQEFPECFTLATPQPLKIDIKKDIVEHWGDTPTFSKTKLQQALYYYTNSAAYLNAFKLEPVRVDLNGNPAADVLESERDYAFKRYCAMYKKPKPAPRKPGTGRYFNEEAPTSLTKTAAAFGEATSKPSPTVEIIKKPSRRKPSLLKRSPLL